MKSARIFIQLGRVGDILNILPLAKRYFDETGRKAFVQVAAEFSGLLDGVSYCAALPYYGPWDTPFLAMREARNLSDDLVLCQIHGAGICNPHQTSSFAREAWHSAAADIPWGSVPLVIDRRDPDREAELITRHTSTTCGKRIVLFSGRGTSSPFPFAKPVLETLRRRLAELNVEVIDLGDVQAVRFFDLLGLFERAACLVSIDTAHQHLAAACPNLPVVAICTRDPSSWHGSPWRKEHVDRLFYDEFPAATDRLFNAVSRGVGRAYPRKIVHVWADWRTERTAESQRRAEVAQASWQIEYATGRWIPCQVLREETDRDGMSIGDPHNVNFVHDTVDRALRQATNAGDIIALTNADIGFTPGLTGKIIEVVTRHGAAFTHRRDFDHIGQPFVSEAEVKLGKFYPGTDAFFFTVEWWRAHRAEYGDFLMGREYWDEVLRQLVKYTGGRGIEFAVWHEWHESFWSGEARETMAGNVHNHRLRAEWFTRTGLQEEDFRWWQSAEGVNHPEPETPKPVVAS